MKRDYTQRFGFLVNDVSKLYGEQFDRLARERIGLSRAQCRVLGTLAMHGDEGPPLSQAELAQRIELSAMAAGALCERLEAAGWIHRQPSPTDRRMNEVRLAPSAVKALDAALTISDQVQARALAALSADERAQLVSLLGKAREGLLALQSAPQEIAP
ncbi:MarR family transcriptional regulator [Variovorax sp. J22R133]|uniref:MarR family winged helix-turn-helix transcriptional regulator n=1 Tax=Variovorax brevis TaxID=3053503 RepID=UPI002575CEDE|nr:MarR family transcriptional regulator [Variovorax sp. J22R133]MDM0113622.1 MarR family transcriptional regulator [Variovorax sp. J22R133]